MDPVFMLSLLPQEAFPNTLCFKLVFFRLLDEFGDGVGVAQVISYVDPQFFTYMALEERLAQAMEVLKCSSCFLY